ncbi:hypothetical protein POVWA1_013260 [Plasmodium ovale wallikeri]|uniref:Uncharacterized protein n=1 Tax=Plasmodium ovale wallikeri TaxID=864142 RepID=A0A1A8YM75_PLAOA|nr:hypothetical protein POVWA1_013260 [Plasmodium ovale wallikeri]
MLVGNKRETMGLGLSQLHRRSKKGKDGIIENCEAKEATCSISKQSIAWHSIEQHSKVRSIFLSVVEQTCVGDDMHIAVAPIKLSRACETVIRKSVANASLKQKGEGYFMNEERGTRNAEETP